MNFGGHLMAGWLIANGGDYSRVERRVITLMAVAPDTDGLFILGPSAWREWHRTFSHNLFWAILVPLLVLIFLPRGRRVRLAPLLYVAMLSHFLLDLFVTGWWILMPLWPVSEWGILMTDWIPENVMKYYIQLGLFVILAFPTLYIMIKHRRTPFEILGGRLDMFFQRFIMLPFQKKCVFCKARAFYLCDECGASLCGNHRSFTGIFRTSCKDRRHPFREHDPKGGSNSAEYARTDFTKG